MRDSSVSSAIPSSEITMCSSAMRIDHRCMPGRKQSSAGESADSAASISRRLRSFDHFLRTLFKIKKIRPARQNLWSWPAHLPPYVSSDAQIESSAPQRPDFRHLTPIGLFRQTALAFGWREPWNAQSARLKIAKRPSSAFDAAQSLSCSAPSAASDCQGRRFSLMSAASG
jgi:hypothetical protein